MLKKTSKEHTERKIYIEKTVITPKKQYATVVLKKIKQPKEVIVPVTIIEEIPKDKSIVNIQK